MSGGDGGRRRPMVGWCNVREGLGLIRTVRRRWFLEANPEESIVMISWLGKGSEKRRPKGFRQGTLTGGQQCPAVKRQSGSR